MKKLQDIDFNNKTALIRADLNVPLDSNLKVTNSARIQGFAPSAKYILEQGGKIILMSHLGRPKGEKKAEFSLKSIVSELEKHLGTDVDFVEDCIGEEVNQAAKKLQPGRVLLLENLRFHSAEVEGDPQFAKELAGLADIYINDAFGTAHRAHASMVAVAELFSEKAPGFLMQKEIDYFNKALVTPEHPLCVILGGAKVSTKLPVIQNLSDKADKIIIGGAMANTFIAASGKEVGKSLYEPEMFEEVKALNQKLQNNACELYLPLDFKLGTAHDAPSSGQIADANSIPADLMALDIGPETIKNFSDLLQDVATIVWNGPMGAFENPDFAEGTLELAQTIAQSKALSVIGGGDSVAAVEQMNLANQFDFISTGGGAFLELLEGKELPGFKALES